MGMRRSVLLAAAAIGTLALTGCIGGPPNATQIAERFATPIEPVWTTQIPGIYGDVVIEDGVVLAYAIDDEVGMRLTAVELETGDILWEQTASPGGAYGNPLFAAYDAASRAYPLPTITPTVVARGEGDETEHLVVYTERDFVPGLIRNSDLLRVVDLHTGDPVEVTMPGIDPDEYRSIYAGLRDDGTIFANFDTPAWPCGSDLCWAIGDEETDRGSAIFSFDPDSLEARIIPGFLPPTVEEPRSPDYGMEYASFAADAGFRVERWVDGDELWSIGIDELFDRKGTLVPDFTGVREVGEVVLVQGYQSLVETDYQGTYAYELDLVESRTLTAVDRESGELLWRLEGGDMLCHAVHERPVPDDSSSVPICVATAGWFAFDIDAGDFIDQEELEASIADLDVATGELGWTSEGAGVASISHVARLADVAYAARGDFTVVDRDEETGVLDLRDGAWQPVTAEGATFVCKAERPDVLPEIPGSNFSGGANPITTGYPAGWRHFPCDATGVEVPAWSRGAVGVAGYRAEGSGIVVLPSALGLVAFDLAAQG